MFDRIRSEVSLLHVVGSYVKLKKTGSNFLGLCPFHSEKSPSFVVNVEKNFYHCFGCGAHGDAIGFISKIKNITYKSAAIQLARENNLRIDFTDYKQDHKNDERESFYKILDLTNKFFVRCLNQATQNYLASRLIPEKLINQFEIGYAPKGNKLIYYLESQGIKQDDMVKLGLVKQNSQGLKYDFFRDRIIFPIQGYNNKTVGFGSRSISENDKIKYFNSPESELFKKANLLFGYNHAVKNACKKNRYVVVEGYLDVISMHKVGIDETVGVLGTAITSSHLEKMWSSVDEIVLFLDSDNAGQKAKFKAVLLALEMINANKTMSVITTSFVGDPDDFIKLNGSEDQAYINNAIRDRDTISSYLFKKEIKEGDLSSPEGISKIESILNGYVNLIKDFSLRKNFKFFFKEQLRKIISSKNKKNLTKHSSKLQSNDEKIFNFESDYSNNPITHVECEILKVLLYYPVVQDNEVIMELLSKVNFTNSNVSSVFSYILDHEWKGDKPFNDSSVLLCLKNLKLSNFNNQNRPISSKEISSIQNKLQILCSRHKIEELKQEYYKKVLANTDNVVLQSYLLEIKELEKSINAKLIEIDD